jgi:ribosomal protein S18 acetylase RimI-like enzyme
MSRPSPFSLREMTLADYGQVLALWQAAEGVGLSDADSRPSIASYLERNPGLSFVALTEEGDLIAAVLCGHDGRRGFIHHLAVAAAWRHCGVGRTLAEACLGRLREQGIQKCHLFVFGRNEPGRAFWRQIGWIEREELVVMSRSLT